MKKFELALCASVMLACLSCADGQAHLKTKPVSVDALPYQLAYKGEVTNAITYQDALGSNLIITTAWVGESRNEQGLPSGDKEIYAYHYLLEKDTATLLWRVYDFEKGCELDIFAEFIENTLHVTDLNDDGVAEVWLMYKTNCTSDLSPYTMKIIMYENQNKYAMRGRSVIDGGGYDEGGEYEFDAVFTNGHAKFREFAQALWSKHITGE